MNVQRRGGEAERLHPGAYPVFAQLVQNRVAAHLHIAEGYVSRAYCIRPSQFFLQTRGERHVSQARQLVMYLAHVELGLSLEHVGHRYHRHRSTAAYACRVTESRRDDPEFDELVSQLETLISLKDDPLFFSVCGEAYDEAFAQGF
ncbi:helix-turn-helix domain-containing protein [Roseibium sediminis]|uniref:helix-turn-helix domain-containing protein n=1 Tax=Roseibium sediminis TaxID=1775174 RepID=UPI0013757F15|nr:helix-turn-helix domain-containing protein [Roseibium sediminis]